MLPPHPRVHGVAARAVAAAITVFLPAVTAFGPAVAAPFQVQGIFQFGPAHIGIAFTDSVNVAQALQLSHYTVTPQGGAAAITLQTAALQDNQRTVILTTTASLPASATYGVTVSGITSKGGTPLSAGGPTSFTTATETVTGIADVQADVNNLIGQVVTVIGEVYIRASSSGSTPSGYIQDGTGRGLNLFGSPLLAPTDTLGTVVKVTGTVALFFTTVEISSYTATTIAAQMPPLAPRVLSVAQASSSQWEGTYLQTTATLTGPPVASGANNYNYPASDAGTAFIFRVRNSTGISPSGFTTGDVVTGAGAGTVFQGTYEVIIGNAQDFYKGRGPGDITPPALVSAAGEGGASTVTVEFSEPVGVGAGTPSNYTVYPSASPGSPIPVTAASVSGTTVVLTLAAPLQASTDYTVQVSNVQDSAGNPIAPGSTVAFTATVPTPFQVTGVFQFGAGYVGVGFSKQVNASQAIQAAHYAFTPALPLAQVTLQENGRTAILKSSAPLPPGSSYSVSVSGITSATGEALAGGGPFSLAIATETVVDIATIQADVAAWSGLTVTVTGQTFIPVGSRGGTPSGYLQDGSGHGINLFGGSIQGAVNALGSVAKVTGTVALFFTTTEITNYTATPLASNQPHLGARQLTVAQANSSSWEGTYIESSASLTDIQPSGTSNVNYSAAEGGSSITFRVGNGLGIQSTDFAIGDRVTGRGAGGTFQSTFQINVGNKQDFFRAGTGGPDTTRPTLVSASAAPQSSELTLGYSEPVNSAGATLISNYRVTPAADPAAPIGITGIVMSASGRSVVLTLDAPLQARTPYVVEVSNVADLAGNVILPGSVITFTVPEPPPQGARLRVPPVTLIRNLTRQGELFRFEIAGVQDTKAICRIFDLQGRLVKVLFDGRLTGTSARTLSWDGRDESFEFAPAGLYICHLQTTDLQGHVSEDRAPIVVAVRLR